jgi:hypothetical protein
MFLKGAIRSGTKGRRTAIFATTMVALMSVPVIMLFAHNSLNVPGDLGNTGAPGDTKAGCANCHGTLTTPSAITVNTPTTPYTPGVAMPLTITIPAAGQFELTVLTAPTATTPNVPAGILAPALTPGAAFAQSAVTMLGSSQRLYSTVNTTSWPFTWTPPATSVGDVVVYVDGGTHGVNYLGSFTIMAPTTTPTPPTITVSPTSLTFNVNNGVVTPTSGMINVTSSGASIAYTTMSSTTNCGTGWLSAVPPGGSTPTPVTVSVPSSLPAGTCTGSVVITPATGAASNGAAQIVSVTANVAAPPPPTLPTLSLSSAGLTFTATAGGSAPTAQSVMVSTSDGSAVTFNDAPSTTSGGNWLTVGGSTGTGTGTTAASESIGVAPTVLTGLAAGTYHGSVAFSSTAVSNSPRTLPVTLTVNPSTPPPPPPTTSSETFSLVVVDRLSGGTDWMLLDGSGSVNSSGTPSGSGFFTRFHLPRTSEHEGGGTITITTIVSSGTWKPTGVATYTPISGSSTGGTLVLPVQITTNGVSTPSTGTLTITSTGTTAGVTLAISGGSTFSSVGIGTESITQRSSGGSGGNGGGTGTGGGTPDN